MNEKPEALADRLDDERMNLIERLADENERLQFERDALLKVLSRAVHYAEWQEKHIHGVGEAVQNWVLKVNLPVPLLEPDKSPEAAFQRFVAALRREET